MESPTDLEARRRHVYMDVLQEKGFVSLRSYNGPEIDPREWEDLEFVNWKSSGAEVFAPIASALGEMENGGFWDKGKPDKDGIWTANAALCPNLVRWTQETGARYGRVRIIKLAPQDNSRAIQLMHLDDNNRLNPDGEGWVVRTWLELTDNPGSYMIVRSDKNDPSTESRIELRKGAQYVVDSERLYHAVTHSGPHTRYAVIASFESGPQLESWIESRMAEEAGAGSRSR
ncbi:MAG TPA: hypothetical protein VJT78_03750 [Candidatus Dormibacteraeota bacterium]|nr:hypothetical protein [Candidatus Dormibacteraeota bacterium]